MMQVPCSNPTEYCRLCFSQHSLQNVLESFDPSKLLLTQIQNCLGLWLAPEDDFPCVVCRLCVSTLNTFQAFRERSGECDLAIKKFRKALPVESIKVEVLNEDGADSDREEGALVIDEPEPVNDELEGAEPSSVVGPVWVPVENAKPRTAQFLCMDCEKIFSSQATLYKHTKHVHGDGDTPPTPRKYYGRDKYKVRRHSCGQCSAVFYGNKEALDHLADAHKATDQEPVAEVITGDINPQVAPPSEQTTSRLKKKPKNSLKCQQCPKRFSCMRTLDVHMRTSCKIQMTQTSESIVSISPKELRKQLFGSTETGGPRPRQPKGTGSCFRCGICNEVLVGSKAFLMHRRTVHGGSVTGELPSKMDVTGGTEA